MIIIFNVLLVLVKKAIIPIMNIKNLTDNFEEVMAYLDKQLTIVQEKLENSNLPERSDEAFINALILELVG